MTNEPLTCEQAVRKTLNILKDCNENEKVSLGVVKEMLIECLRGC